MTSLLHARCGFPSIVTSAFQVNSGTDRNSAWNRSVNGPDLGTSSIGQVFA